MIIYINEIDCNDICTGGVFAHLSMNKMHYLFLLLPEIPSVFRLVQSGSVCHASTEISALCSPLFQFRPCVASVSRCTRRGVDIPSAP